MMKNAPLHHYYFDFHLLIYYTLHKTISQLEVQQVQHKHNETILSHTIIHCYIKQYTTLMYSPYTFSVTSNHITE